MLALIRDGAAFVARTPLVRGLVIGIIGAFAAGGIVIGSATLYAQSLGGGNAAYGVLFASVFIGLALGMGAAPQMARRIPHNRLFGAGIVAAGLALVLVALAPHLFLAIAAVMLVGGFAGIAFLTGLTIIGTEVADEIRGRVNAFVQTIVRLTLLGSLSIVPLIVGLVATRTIGPVTIDGTRVVMFAGGLVAAAVGSIAYRQMDDRRTAPMLPDLLAALRRGEPRGGTGLLVAVEGIGAGGGGRPGRPAGRSACAPRATPSSRSKAGPPIASGGRRRCGRRRCRGPARGRWRRRRSWPTRSSAWCGPRSRRARWSWPTGSSPCHWPSSGSRRTASGPRRAGETRGLGHRAAAAGRVGAARPRPRPMGLPPASGLAGEEHVRVRRLLTHMAAAEPHRYVVVDADGPADEVAERIAVGLTPLLPPAPSAEATVPTPLPRPSADPATVGIAAGGHASTGYGPTSSAPAHPPGSGADTGPIRRAEPLRATPSTADTAPIAAAHPRSQIESSTAPPPNSPKAAP